VSEDIRVQKGKLVVISLESNPSTGFGWMADFDPHFIRLVKRQFTHLSNLLGASGIEKFEFEALASGVTTLKMVYKRAWETTFSKEKMYTIHIA
jgi:predicted secreted protein